jgi:SAM-dependent methyltransferase
MNNVLGAPRRANSAPTTRRGPYQGIAQILRFNWRFYAGTAIAIAALWLVVPRLPLPQGARLLLLAATLPALYWMGASLVASHYIYDRFPLYDLNWIADSLTRPPQRWANIHAGLDETSHRLAALFPQAEGAILDIYDPREMTEPSIEQARRAPGPSRMKAVHADWRALPLEDHALDVALVLFAAHELRHHDARVQFFGELVRALRSDGEVVVMEHLRDWPNFLAFGPGFLHFFSRVSWRRAVAEAGLQVRIEFSVTPFVHVFILRRTV